MAGDQSASMVGQNALSNGNVKNTYGTGSFIMANTGKRILNAHGLISTVAYSLNDGCAYYALEGSIFNSGSAFEWALKALNGKNTWYNLDNKMMFTLFRHFLAWDHLTGMMVPVACL
ncbi:FGGY-family carbohydrate kinase [Acidiplasma cupricumulans]|uniref:FGGY-family carbohydrate kinase n=1 Tax=Acidiplasma cupricumulans TaxID=312540 RepID=UPI001584BE53|nr:FGGY-family carbohydrate kinase [Acidiplasma cupricumulans]